LLLHSLQRLSTVNAGYEPAGVLTFQLVASPESPGNRKLVLADNLVHRLSKRFQP